MSPSLRLTLSARTFVQNVFHQMKGRRGEREKESPVQMFVPGDK